jgi:MFS family permease
MDVGWLGFIAATGSLCFGPIYGWLLDKKGPFFAMSLAASFCSLGCFIRCIAANLTTLYIGTGLLGLGAANLWCVLVRCLFDSIVGVEIRWSGGLGHLQQISSTSHFFRHLLHTCQK